MGDSFEKKYDFFDKSKYPTWDVEEKKALVERVSNGIRSGRTKASVLEEVAKERGLAVQTIQNHYHRAIRKYGRQGNRTKQSQKSMSKNNWTSEKDSLILEAARCKNRERAFRDLAEQIGHSAAAISTRYYTVLRNKKEQQQATTEVHDQTRRSWEHSLEQIRLDMLRLQNENQKITEQLTVINQQAVYWKAKYEELERDTSDVMRILNRARQLEMNISSNQQSFRLDRNGNLEPVRTGTEVS